jgi:O-antigen/teichoic acid export membrane protein
MNAFVLNSLYSALVTWIVATSTTNINTAISKKIHKNLHAQRAAVWAATFGVAFVTAFAVYLLLKLIFGYGRGMLGATSQSVRQRRQIDALSGQTPQQARTLGRSSGPRI